MRADPEFPTAPLSDHALRGRTIVITGASDGIGRSLAERAAAAGAAVVLVGRNEAKTRHVASRIMHDTGSRIVTFEIANLLLLDEQHALAERLAARYPAIHGLVNNAGAIFMERAETSDGLERTFALNHVAYMVLAVKLYPVLAAAASAGAPARIINIASRAHQGARIQLDDLHCSRGYSGWRAYGRSKLANILLTRELATRYDSARVVVHAVHPGLVASRFAANNGVMGRLQRRVMDWFSVSADAGADTAAWLLNCEESANATGYYWVRRQRVIPSRAARDDAMAHALFEATSQLARL